jgi:hypothetical protein
LSRFFSLPSGLLLDPYDEQRTQASAATIADTGHHPTLAARMLPGGFPKKQAKLKAFDVSVV